MRKLGKKVNEILETVEAYCNCYVTCNSQCNCGDCGCTDIQYGTAGAYYGIGSATLTNISNVANSVISGSART